MLLGFLNMTHTIVIWKSCCSQIKPHISQCINARRTPRNLPCFEMCDSEWLYVFKPQLCVTPPFQHPKAQIKPQQRWAHLNLIAQPSPPLSETMCCVGYLYVCVLVGGVIQDVREACQPGPVNLSEIMCRWWIPLYGLLIWLEYLRDAITGMMRMRGWCCGLAYLGLPLCQLSVCSLLFLSFLSLHLPPALPLWLPPFGCVCVSSERLGFLCSQDLLVHCHLRSLMFSDCESTQCLSQKHNTFAKDLSLFSA